MGLLFDLLLGKPDADPQQQWIIEFRGKFWNGYKFAKQSEAMMFASNRSAWDYVDATFSAHTAEDCSLRRSK